VVGVLDPERDYFAASCDTDGREVVYHPDDIALIVTGVPRSPRYYEAQPRATEDRKLTFTEHRRTYEDTKPIPPLPKPAPEVKPPPNPGAGSNASAGAIAGRQRPRRGNLRLV
jgi:hypothetical protein